MYSEKKAQEYYDRMSTIEPLREVANMPMPVYAEDLMTLAENEEIAIRDESFLNFMEGIGCQ